MIARRERSRRIVIDDMAAAVDQIDPHLIQRMEWLEVYLRGLIASVKFGYDVAVDQLKVIVEFLGLELLLPVVLEEHKAS